MRRTLLACLAALVGAACPLFARAQSDLSPYYSKTYNDCINAAAGSTYPMHDCLSAEHDAWDKSLNAIYQTRMASRSGAEKTQLRDQERAWLKTTQHKCDHASDDEQGGSLQGIEVDQCYLDETIRRTLALRALS